MKNSFRTELELCYELSNIGQNKNKPSEKNNNRQIMFCDKILSMGSCFADNMGEKLKYFKFPVAVNPFGVVYNPLSLIHLLNRSLRNLEFTAEDFFENRNLFLSYQFHSSLAALELNAAKAQANAALNVSRDYLVNGQVLMITLGSAWVYERKLNSQIVANCHKQPQKEFTKRLLQLDEIKESMVSFFNDLQSVRARNSALTSASPLKVILTISPVRHLHDGFHENQLSKATLLLAVEKVMREMNNNSFFHFAYFPSYELMMDDLRDYRFYASDMVHPNSMAIDYIWEKFCQKWIAPQAIALFPGISRVQKAIEHRPLFPQSPDYNQFILKEYEFVKKLHEKDNCLDLSVELGLLEKKLFIDK